ncbi:Uncharacterized conserved protein YloU, alkaline shock protein (Asp23) family [Marininema mesophilum]|uniref:Uncharacterized conserved protein YloU, alkaline shock protein (Asp23) family n=1 Tax=Marininema mesophilum TaxID=1048340 RepID=A0A1H2UDP1_9BACL|nr:Asp23/Gls24 family envelope stress response protein [Marininema mesophilum]SDW53659.1 Uncharacterized conserved protein YloU, alkaline shock protein (Asp23) family [Marininema mesophilum]
MENEIFHHETQLTELGKVEIAPEVIQIVAGIAALKVEGVAGTSGGVVGDITQFLGRKNPKQGIKVELTEDASISVSIVVHYGYSIPEIGKQVQESVKSAVESMTGLAVSSISVRVAEVKFVADQDRSTKETDSSQRVK